MPKRSQLSSSKLGPLWDAIDEFDAEVLPTRDDLKAALENLVSIATDIQGEYEDSLNNMPTQEGPIAETMQESIDHLQAYIQELENVDFSVEEEDDDTDDRAETEADVAEDMLGDLEDPPDYDSILLREDPMYRGEVVEEHLDFAEYEEEVNRRLADKEESDEEDDLEEVRTIATDVVSSFEL